MCSNPLPGYDSWKTETPEEEAESVRGHIRRYRDLDERAFDEARDALDEGEEA